MQLDLVFDLAPSDRDGEAPTSARRTPARIMCRAVRRFDAVRMLVTVSAY
jgi:hypothetical protein